MNDNFFLVLRERIKPYFELYGSHDFSHTERVYNLALEIAKNKDVDLDIIKAAALLHDISRKKEDEGGCECHAEDGARVAAELLSELNFPEEKIKKVVHAIEAHRYSKGKKAETKEAEILQDADRLDALGAICIARIFNHGAKINRPFYDPKIKPAEKYTSAPSTSINHFYEKILNIKPETFKTLRAREIAKDRYHFIQEFIKRFIKEWNSDLT